MEYVRHSRTSANIHPVERIASVLGGGTLAASGIRRGGPLGILRAVAGALLVHRGISGYCFGYRLLGVRTAPSTATLPYELGVRARAAVTIDAPRRELFDFWRDFENLPRFVRHLIEVEPLGENRTRWSAQGPLGGKVTWDAELINEIPAELIAWKSLPGSDVDSAGSVRFCDAPGGRGTEVRVKLQYNPPAGIVGAYVASFFGREPEQEIAADLARLKQFLESGEVATTQGQPQGGTAAGRAIGMKLEEAIP